MGIGGCALTRARTASHPVSTRPIPMIRRRSLLYGMAGLVLGAAALAMPDWIPSEYRTVVSWAAVAFGIVATYFRICEVRPGGWVQRAVNVRLAKALTPLLVILAVVVTFPERYEYWTSLAWPALGLARLGIPHTWPVVVVLIPTLLVWGCLQCRDKPWWRILAVSLLGFLCYSAAAKAFLVHSPVPVPSKDPYGADPSKRAAFRSGYDEGFRMAMVGRYPSYCFRPEAETRGFYEGSLDGGVVWYRMLGRPMPRYLQRMIVDSAQIDGVDLRKDSVPRTNAAAARR